MNHLYILNPEGNDGKGTITRYVGKGAGIRDHIDLINVVIDANKAATAMYDQAVADGVDVLDISGPAQIAADARALLMRQASTN